LQGYISFGFEDYILPVDLNQPESIEDAIFLDSDDEDEEIEEVNIISSTLIGSNTRFINYIHCIGTKIPVIQLAAKKKRGRKPNAKPALVVDEFDILYDIYNKMQ
jgi:hypothetical protein